MDFHSCEYCKKAMDEEGKDRVAHVRPRRYHPISSGDITLRLNNGATYIVPDMILHYICDHSWRPPQRFINDVLDRPFIHTSVPLPPSPPPRIGYLHASDLELNQGSVPLLFVARLEIILHEAVQCDGRLQARSC